MLLKFTPHAQMRLHERGFTPEQVKKVITSPDGKENTGEDCVKVWKKFPHGLILKVVYKRDLFRDRKESYFIITAYFIQHKK
jgi:hypothetical protein